MLKEFPNEVAIEDAPVIGPHLAWTNPRGCSVIYSLGWVRKDGLLYDDKIVRGDGSLIDFVHPGRWYDERWYE